MKKILLMLCFLLFVSVVAASPPQPKPIGGRILVDDNPVDELQATIMVIDSGEEEVVYSNANGYYTTTFSMVETGDTVKISCYYNEEQYTNEILFDSNYLTNWLNLSIQTTNEEDDDDDTENNNGGGGLPPPDENDEGEELIADFSIHPLQPMINQTVYFDSDTDAESYRWKIENKNIYGKEIQHIFKKSGSYIIELTVYRDTEESSIIKTVYVSAIEEDDVEPNATMRVRTTYENGTPYSTNIEIYKNETLIKTMKTNETGEIKISIEKGKYVVKTETEERTIYLFSDETVSFQKTNQNNNEEDDKTIDTSDDVDNSSFNWYLLLIPIVIIIGGVILWRVRY